MKKQRWLWTAVAIILTGGGFAAWWFLGSEHGPPVPREPITGPEAKFIPVVESQIELPSGVTISFSRAVLHISEGTGAAAMRDYLKKKAEAGELTDPYEIFSNKGRFLALGPALKGRLDRLPPQIEELLNPWKETIPVGRASGFAVYQLR